MKNFILTAVSTLLIIGSASAQTNFRGGVTFGSNYSSLRSDLFNVSSGRLGIAAGCAFALEFGDRFELNPEIAFVQKGATAQVVRFMPSESIETATYNYHYNTFEAGLFAGYQPFKEIPIRLQAGGFFGNTSNNLDLSQRDLCVGDYKDIFKAVPATKLNQAFSGLDFGPAVGLSVGTQRIRVNARYYMGAKNLYNNVDYVPAGPSIRTSAVRLTMTYFLK